MVEAERMQMRVEDNMHVLHKPGRRWPHSKPKGLVSSEGPSASPTPP